METLQTTQPSRFCRKCGYALVGLSEHRCPECGRAFDPGNPRTYLHQPRSWTVRRWTRRIALTLAAAGLAVVVGLGSLWAYVYWEYHADWRAEQNAIAALKRAGVGIDDPAMRSSFDRTIRLACPPWLDRLTRPLTYLRDRVYYVQLDLENKELTGADFANLAVFKHLATMNVGAMLVTDGQLAYLKDITHLEKLFILSHYSEFTDAGLEHVGGLTQLTRLSVWGPKITGKGLSHLRTLSGLQRLDLSNTQIGDDDLHLLKAFPAIRVLGLNGAPITGAGLVHLKELPGLQTVYLTETKTTDAGLRPLGQLSLLRTLSLQGTQVTDAGLEHLEGLKNLRELDLTGTQVTRQGVESLRKALPAARIQWSEDRRGSFPSKD